MAGLAETIVIGNALYKAGKRIKGSVQGVGKGIQSYNKSQQIQQKKQVQAQKKMQQASKPKPVAQPKRVAQPKPVSKPASAKPMKTSPKPNIKKK